MKRLLSLLTMMLVAFGVQAESNFYFGTLSIKPGETKKIELNLLNEAICEGFQLKLTLPEGLSFIEDEDEEDFVVKVSDRVKKKFNIDSNLLSNGSLNLVGYLSGTATIAAGDGAIILLTVKAADNAPLGAGKIKISNAEINLENSVNVNPADAEFDFRVYQEYEVTAVSSSETMGSVTGAGTYEAGTEATITASANEGYQFVKWSDDTTVNPYVFTVNNAVSLTATFEAITYNLTYELANGALPEGKTNPATYTIETEDFTLNNPERTGYDFAGWTGTGLEQATTEVKIAQGSTGARSYVATWTPVTYTITYELGGGQLAEGETNPAAYTIESEGITLKNPTREGYTFAGWTGTELDEASMNVTIATGKYGERSYTATWTPIIYNLTYDLASGALPEGKTNPETYTIETDEITLINPERTAYTFAGWTGTGLDQATTEVKIAKGSTGARSYVATWTPVTYTITYELGGGQLAEGETNPAAYTIESEGITLKNPTREGYTFAGWTGTELDEASMNVTIATGKYGERSYTATWTPVIYNLTYDLASGALPEGKTNPTTYTIETDEITLINPERTAYTFAGWTGTGLDQATTEVKIAQGSTGARSYVATWTPVTYTITYELGGGQLAEGETNPAAYTIESEGITLKNPTREGYTFAGWTGTELDEASMNVTIATGKYGERSYTATWTPIIYTITYDLDGGQLAQGDTNPVEYTIESEGITLKNPTKDGYDFAGWTGGDLTEPTMTVTIAKGSIGNRTYTATWTEASSIKALFRDSKAVNVYTVGGTLVGRDMTVGEVLQLKRGIYVINGKKIVVK